MKEKKTKVIAINAVSGGGKSTTIDELLRRMPNSKAIHFDDRDYRSISGITDLLKWELEGADYNKWDLSLFEEELRTLLDENLDYIFVDYSFGYNQKQISPYISLSVFIDTPLDMCVCRRILRDYQESDASDIIKHMEWYHNMGREAFTHSVEEGIQDADLVVNGSMTLNNICELIENRIMEIV